MVLLTRLANRSSLDSDLPTLLPLLSQPTTRTFGSSKLYNLQSTYIAWTISCSRSRLPLMLQPDFLTLSSFLDTLDLRPKMQATRRNYT